MCGVGILDPEVDDSEIGGEGGVGDEKSALGVALDSRGVGDTEVGVVGASGIGDWNLGFDVPRRAMRYFSSDSSASTFNSASSSLNL